MFEKFVTNHPIMKQIQVRFESSLSDLHQRLVMKEEVVKTLNIRLEESSALTQKMVAEIFQIKEENTLLKSKIEQIELEKKNPRHLIESIMGKKLEWFNYQELAPNEKFQYFQEAQTILNSRVFKNETNYLVSCWAQWALRNSMDFEGVRDMRMSTSALELLKERLEEIEHPGLNISREEIFDAI